MALELQTNGCHLVSDSCSIDTCKNMERDEPVDNSSTIVDKELGVTAHCNMCTDIPLPVVYQKIERCIQKCNKEIG